MILQTREIKKFPLFSEHILYNLFYVCLGLSESVCLISALPIQVRDPHYQLSGT